MFLDSFIWIREFPDGRDLNRVFPGSSKGGSLASRVAHKLDYMKLYHMQIYIMDFHTGGVRSI